ncbi:MAG TPA: PIG-L deacetylase family protein [Gemmatimonadaceae bacterium]|nr:PIG-L deacetylase family protein [Gemmatimonadaceae bacterium]
MRKVRSSSGPLRISIDRRGNAALDVLCLGAHPDDIEIGCGGTLMWLLRNGVPVRCRWVVFSGSAARAAEARASAEHILARASESSIDVYDFRDGFFFASAADIKERFERIKSDFEPDVVFTHCRNDRHQDHRLLAELTWNTFRKHLILEYEVPKYEGDLGHPNFYVPLSAALVRSKVRHLLRHFPSQRSRRWFDAGTFEALMRLRGIESGAMEGFAEAFHAAKLVAGAVK